MEFKDVKLRVEENVEDSLCYVNEFSGGGDHFTLIVVTDLFQGLTHLKKHRMILDLFKEEIASKEVHALSLKTFTKKEWEEEKKNFPLSVYT
jgi:acid stress-induced BolA-like protein IbaG/YrbA